jgi:hypothetical protein
VHPNFPSILALVIGSNKKAGERLDARYGDRTAMLARTLGLFGFALGGVAAAHSSAPVGKTRFGPVQAAAESMPKNPRQLRAAQWLGEPREGAGAGAAARSRVRFEWDQVRGARAYVLRGRWTGDGSWAVRSADHRVTSGSATCWGTRRVEFDVALPTGSHSWRVVALFGPNDSGDFENATRLAFEVR